MSTVVQCLSVRQPWAWAIVEGLKPLENRSRVFNYRGPLLIQASKLPWQEYEEARVFIKGLTGRTPPPSDAIELGGIVGAVMLTDCLPPIAVAAGWRFADQYGLQLERQTRLPFRPIKGFQRLFGVELTKGEQRALRGAGYRL